METAYPGGRGFIRQSFIHRGVPLVGLTPILASLAGSTLTQYQAYYKKWWNFCKHKSHSPYRYLLDIMLSFLSEQYNMGASYSTLNSQHAALSFVFSIQDKDKALLKRF